MRFALALFLSFVGPLVMPAAAQSPARQPTLLVNSNGTNVIVWRDGNAMREGFRLIEAGVHRSRPEMLMPLVACLVPNETPIVVSNGGFATSTILVIDGRHAGCRGDVGNTSIQRPRDR